MPAVPSQDGRTYSQFSLSLVRHEPALPYSGAPALDRSADAVPYLHRLLEAEPFEILGALFLTVRGRPIGHTIPFRGTIASCKVGPRPLLVSAILAHAAKLILFHAHPSGDPRPSPEDIDFSLRMEAAADLLGLRVEDFLVLGEAPRYASVRNGRYILCSAPPPLPPPATPQAEVPAPGRAELTWAGTGFIPVWLREEIEAGAALGEFLVEGARVTAAARQERRIRRRSSKEAPTGTLSDLSKRSNCPRRGPPRQGKVAPTRTGRHPHPRSSITCSPLDELSANDFANRPAAY